MKVYKSEKAKKRVLDTYDQLLAMWNVDKEERDIPTTYGTTHVIMITKLMRYGIKPYILWGMLTHLQI